MAIKEQIVFDAHSKQLVGYVDFGPNHQEVEAEAKEVLVLMIVGMRASWKAPVGYFLTRGLGAEAQVAILKMTIECLIANDFQVHAVTMDGHASNMAMCRLLGCNFDQTPCMKTHFTICGKKIYVFLDACHMVKLIRNSLEAMKTFTSPSGVIEWKYIAELHETQNRIGLRLANKLTNRHVNFQQKMKVRFKVYIFNL